jgi:hypothetical protein
MEQVDRVDDAAVTGRPAEELKSMKMDPTAMLTSAGFETLIVWDAVTLMVRSTEAG